MVGGALMDLLWYGFPWHAQQIYRERLARRSRVRNEDAQAATKTRRRGGW